MRLTHGAAIALLGVALLTPSCARFDFFRRKESTQTCKLGPAVGTPAPDFEGETLDGKRIKLSDYHGKVVVVAFWFGRCGPCRAMIPHEREMVERYRGKPFAMISVYADVDYDNARKIVAEQQMTWPIVKSESAKPAITQQYGVSRFPTFIVIDGAGVVRHAQVGGTGPDAAVAAVSAEMESKR